MYSFTGKITNDEDFDLSFVCADEDDADLDITDLTFEFTMTDSDGNTVFAAGSANVTVTKDVADSSVNIFIDNSHILALDPGQYSVSCRWTDAATSKTRQLFRGALQINEGGF